MRLSIRYGRVLSPLAVLAALVAAPLGCGDSTPATGTKSEPAPEIKKANNPMEDFVNKQKKSPPAK